MENEREVWHSRVFLALVMLNLQYYFAKGEPQVPCYFIFGDSLADSGNNNHLITLARSNFLPYGIDFPTGSTGRFTNGRTVFDMIGELLGLKAYLPPFSSAFTHDILKGVNYASGTAGILDETGKEMGDNISFNIQILHHRCIVSHIIARLRSSNLYNDTAAQHLNKCLYTVVIGSNDYINNYFMPQYYPSSHLFTPQQFADLLIQDYSRQIMSLYDLGGRKFALFGVGNIGCTPNAINSYPTNGSGCVEEMNSAVQFFNEGLKSLVDEFNFSLTDAKFMFVNVSGLQSSNDSTSGFKVLNRGCCQVVGESICIPSVNPCQNRSEYWYWDSFHPTEAADQFIAQRSYRAVDPTDTYPFDISHLVTL
ncbi:hypothetical protein ACOSQ3_011932 [Xanthoceras sorbifolium]